jgi:hypothetical protein
MPKNIVADINCLRRRAFLLAPSPEQQARSILPMGVLSDVERTDHIEIGHFSGIQPELRFRQQGKPRDRLERCFRFPFT